MQPYYEADGITIYHGDCRDVLPTIGPASLTIADPPYHDVLDEAWDTQWASDAEYLDWLDSVIGALERATADNGSLYAFASPRLAGRVEAVTANHYRVIGNCVWDKGSRRLGAAGSGPDVTTLRTYWTSGSERIVFAEKRSVLYDRADKDARDQSGYWTACEGLKRSLVGDYLREEFARAGVTARDIAKLFPSKTGGLTGCVSNWLLGYNMPTADQYETMRRYLNTDKRDEFLRTEYEDLRTEYEDLRRPFSLTRSDQWGDIWRFDPPRNRIHPAQKPLSLVTQMIRVSSRYGDIVIDPCAGSGTTLVAARNLGRKAIGIELEEQPCERMARRLDQTVLDLTPSPPPPTDPEPVLPGLTA